MKTSISSSRISGLLKGTSPDSKLHPDEDRESTLAFSFMMGLIVLGLLYFIVLTFII